MLKELQAHWAWISGDFTASLTVIAVSMTTGFLVAQFFYKQAVSNRDDRLNTLKERLEGKSAEIKTLQEQLAKQISAPTSVQSSSPTLTGPTYPENGFHGKNILSPLVVSADREVPHSMCVDIPAGQRLRIRLQQVSGTASIGEISAWSYRLPPRNWQSDLYDQSRSEQMFDATPGQADLSIRFYRAGEVQIQAFMEGSHMPVWTKSLTVR